VKFGGDNSSSTSPHLPSIVSAILRWTLDMGEKTDGEIGRGGDGETIKVRISDYVIKTYILNAPSSI